MKKMEACPSVEELKRLVLGQIADSAADALERHLAECPRCCETLDVLELKGDVTPVVDMRKGESAAWPEKQVVEHLIGQLKQIQIDALSTQCTDVSKPAGDTPPGGTLQVGDAKVPGYEMLGFLGRGGMGAVLRGYDPDLGRDVAVKVLLEEHRGHPEFLRRFLDEARINGQLQHPGVVPVHELGWLPDGRPFFTMKLVQGRTLAELLQERSDRAHDLPRFLTIFEQICQALAHAHERGVIHRDLKPANIMVGGFGEVQVMDWGLAKALRRPGADVSHHASLPSFEATSTPTALATGDTPTLPSPREEIVKGADAPTEGSQPGHAVGTPAFMPPEQARGEIERMDERADVFGLGGILCVILTGQPPYAGRHLGEVYRQATRGEVGPALTRLHGCGAGADLVRLCQECLAPELEARPRDAGVVARRVTVYQAGVQERLRQAELERAAAQVKAAEERKRRRLAVGLAAALLGLVVAGGGTGVWLLQQQAELRRGVETALDKLPGLLRQWRWGEAETVLGEAESRLGEAGPADLRGRASHARADLNLAIRLDGIRQKRATLVDGKFDDRSADQDYAAAFRAAGLWHEGEEKEVVAARIRESAIQGHLLAALDDWANVPMDQPRWAWLLGVASRAASDEWGARFRDPKVWGDRDALRQLMDKAKVAELSPQLLTTVGLLMRRMQMDAVPWWTAAQSHHPNDFWLNYHLGIALRSAKQPGEAVGYYRAALAIRPDSVAAYITLGNALKDKGQLGEAIQVYRRALALDPRVALAHDNLGLALMATGKLDEAITAYRRAVELDPKYGAAHGNLGLALDAKGRTSEAIAAYRQAIELVPRDVKARNNLGMLLLNKGDMDEAVREFRQAVELEAKLGMIHVNLGIALRGLGRREEAITEFRKAIHLDPKDGRAHGGLGLALLEQGSFLEARTALGRCRDLLPEGAAFRESAVQQLRRYERQFALDEKLAAFLKGDAQSQGADELLVLAQFCREHKRLFATAARLYSEAFETHRELRRVIAAGHRYHAACAAAQAGCGQGDGSALGDKERALLRKQSLDWLRADLVVVSAQAESDQPGARDAAHRALRLWRDDADLACVRSPEALGKLPQTERAAWRKLWDDVAAVLAK